MHGRELVGFIWVFVTFTLQRRYEGDGFFVILYFIFYFIFFVGLDQHWATDGLCFELDSSGNENAAFFRFSRIR